MSVYPENALDEILEKTEYYARNGRDENITILETFNQIGEEREEKFFNRF